MVTLFIIDLLLPTVSVANHSTVIVDMFTLSPASCLSWTYWSILSIALRGTSPVLRQSHTRLTQWASFQMWKLQVAHEPGMPGTFSPPPRLSDPDMHHGTCVMHVPWCIPGSLTSGFHWSRRHEKRSRHSRRMCNPQFYVSGKRPMQGNQPCGIRPIKSHESAQNHDVITTKQSAAKLQIHMYAIYSC